LIDHQTIDVMIVDYESQTTLQIELKSFGKTEEFGMIAETQQNIQKRIQTLISPSGRTVSYSSWGFTILKANLQHYYSHEFNLRVEYESRF
jgi:hypothetical protein